MVKGIGGIDGVIRPYPYAVRFYEDSLTPRTKEVASPIEDQHQPFWGALENVNVVLRVNSDRRDHPEPWPLLAPAPILRYLVPIITCTE
jgi:hypothetical protein